MIKIFLTVGAPASLKSSWVKSEVAKDPLNSVRINNDDLRLSFNGSVYSSDYEKFITETRNWLIRESIKRNIKNIFIDNCNTNRRHFDTVCKIAESMGKDIMVCEKPFYAELDELILRDSKRTGTAKVGEAVIKKFWKELGGTQHQFYKPRTQIFNKKTSASERFVDPMVQDESLEKCAIFDLDGTMADIRHRNPYDASHCNTDKPNQHVVDLCKLLHENGYKIFFFSGREDEHRVMTSEWLDKHFGYSYELYMRETGNKEDDRLLKERLFNTHIKDKYNCKLWVDDRLRVCKMVHEIGLPLFRVGDPEANF